MAGVGSSTHIVICSAITGSGTSVTYDSAGTWVFIKCKNPKKSIKFTSRNKHSGYHKSGVNPDKKYIQSYTVSGGKFKTKDIDDACEWIVEAYNTNKKIYLLVDRPDGIGGYEKRSWYNSSNTKVYYLKGLLLNWDDEQLEGKLSKISFKFEESWRGL